MKVKEGESMLLTLDFSSDIPIYVQIRNEIVQAIGDGRLKDGEKLPTVRALAAEAGINSMTVNKAYKLLKLEGYIITDRRNGAVVHLSKNEDNSMPEELADKIGLMVAETKAKGVTIDRLVAYIREIYGADNKDKEGEK